MRKLLIFPCNGNGLEAVDCLSTEFELIGFVDDTPEKQGASPSGIPVFGREAFSRFADAMVLAVPGSPTSFHLRDKIVTGLGLDQNRFATVIHKAASVSPRAKLGKNVLLMAGVVITGNAKVEDHVCVLPNTVIHHDSIIGEWSLLGSNVTIAGYTTVGKSCYIGSGSSVINGISLGDKCLVGMGSNVIRSVEPGSRIAGNPARKL